MTGFVALALGLILRIAMYVSPKSLWGDEWFSLGLAQQPLAATFAGAARDVHPPFYFLVLHEVIRFFGTSEWALRSVSLVASIAALYLTGRVAELLFDKKTSIWAMALTACSAYWIQPANEIRGYSLVSALVLASAALAIRLASGASSKKMSAAFATVTALCVYTEHLAWFWLLAVGVYALFLARGGNRRLLRPMFWVLVVALPSIGLIAYQAVWHEHAFEASRVLPNYDPKLWVKKIAGVFWHFSNGYRFSMITLDGLKNLIRSSAFFWFSAASATCAVGAVGISLKQLWKNRPVWLMLVGAGLAPVVVFALLYPIRLHARYLIVAAPFFTILVAYGLSRIPRRSIAVAAGVLILGVNLVGSALAIASATDSVHKEDYPAAVTWIFERAGTKDAVCGFAPPIQYYGRKALQTSKALILPGTESLTPAIARSLEKVFVLDYVNMDPAISEGLYRIQVERMRVLGFEPSAAPISFGGQESLTRVYVFLKRTRS